MKKILLPTDFSENAFNALKYALTLFKDQPCNFILLHAYEEPKGSEGTFIAIKYLIKKDVARHFKKLMRKIDGLQPEKQHTFESRTIYGSMSNSTLNVAKKKNVDMIILGTKGASGLKEKLIGSNTATLLRDASYPVIAVPESATFNGLKNIVLASDFNPISDKNILEPLIETVEHFKSRLMVLHTYEESPLNPAENEKEERIKLSKYFINIDDSYHYIKNNDPLKGIDQFIEENDIQLLAMITRDHRFFERILHVSSVEKMAFHTKVPLLALHN